MSDIISTLSIELFKKEYFRKFTNFSPYPRWSASSNYLINQLVYFDQDYLVYKALTNNINKLPNISTSDWEMQSNLTIVPYITDTDLDEAFLYAANNISSSLVKDFDRTTGFYLLVAHFLELNVNQASKTDSAGGSLVASKSIAGVSVAYNTNEAYKNLLYTNFAKTKYGRDYITLIEQKNSNIIYLVKGGYS